jgi:hypothetical protein
MSNGSARSARHSAHSRRQKSASFSPGRSLQVKFTCPPSRSGAAGEMIEETMVFINLSDGRQLNLVTNNTYPMTGQKLLFE